MPSEESAPVFHRTEKRNSFFDAAYVSFSYITRIFFPLLQYAVYLKHCFRAFFVFKTLKNFFITFSKYQKPFL